MTFFGGEPLLNLPVLYDLAERMWAATRERGVRMMTSIITNGLLLTADVVDRLLPRGLQGVKITLDGDRDTHNRMRPLRGGQGTFDRIVDNIRQVAGEGADRDRRQLRRVVGRQLSGAARLPARAGVRRQAREGELQAGDPHAGSRTPKGILPLTPVSADGKPLGGTCMTSAGAGGLGTACDSCNFLDDQMTFLRDETKRHGFPTPDGVHNGPCHVHIEHAHTIGPDGSLYACPGIHRRARPVDRTHRRPPRSRCAPNRARTIRPPGSVERVRRLRVHPRLCRGMPGGIAHTAWRHEHADMSQADL